MDGLSNYNQIEITLEDRQKNAFIYPWGNFAYCFMHFSFKNARDTFHHAMFYSFHNLEHISISFVDDLTVKS